MSRTDELRELDDHSLLELRFRLATGQLDNVSEIGKARREIARILTVLREREIAAAEAMEATR
jgi:large subunit ribosomal protein L29